MAQTLGLITLIWQGTQVPIEKGGTVTLGGLVQKPVITGAVVDYADEMQASKIECTGRIKRGDALLTLFGAGSGELQVQCDTGQTYVWPDAFVDAPLRFSGDDGGKLKLSFGAGIPQEILNG